MIDNFSFSRKGLDRLQAIKEELNEEVEKRSALTKVVYLEEKESHAFPYEVFPDTIQAVINEWHKAFPLPAEYFAAGILAAFSGAIGNSLKVEYKRGYQEPGLLYMALVGPPGLGKTPALKRAMNPLVKQEINFRENYKSAKVTYAEVCHEIKENKESTPKPPPPLCRELIIDDSTTEAVAGLMRENPKGLILIKDELMGFIGGMNKYNKGSDAEFWLSTWSNTIAKTNRATKETVFVKSSYVTIVGGIQDSLVNKLATAANINNGFASRFLFIVPDSFDRKPDSEYEADSAVIKKYQQVLSFLFEQLEKTCGSAQLYEGYATGFSVHPGKMRMTSEAKTVFLQWKNKMIEKGNHSSSEWERGSLTKLEAYCLRFSLILELIQAACEEKEIRKEGDEEEPHINLEIQLKTVQKAIQLCAYFEAMLNRIIDNLSQGKEESALSTLPKSHLNVYKELSNQFERSEAMELADKWKLSESSIKRFLKRKDLFARIGHGKYKKTIAVNNE